VIRAGDRSAAGTEQPVANDRPQRDHLEFLVAIPVNATLLHRDDPTPDGGTAAGAQDDSTAPINVRSRAIEISVIWPIFVDGSSPTLIQFQTVRSLTFAS
jgi:hypothetical protein